LSATVGKEVPSVGSRSMMMMDASSIVLKSLDTAVTSVDAAAPVGLLRVSLRACGQIIQHAGPQSVYLIYLIQWEGGCASLLVHLCCHAVPTKVRKSTAACMPPTSLLGPNAHPRCAPPPPGPAPALMAANTQAFIRSPSLPCVGGEHKRRAKQQVDLSYLCERQHVPEPI
jgi:hypothetical protein